MLSLELVLISLGLVVSFVCRGHRRTIFHLSILLFLIALVIGSVKVVIGGITVLGLGMIDASLASNQPLRSRVFAVTAALMFASVLLPVVQTSDDLLPPTDATANPRATLLSELDAQLNTSLRADRIDPLALLVENREAVDQIAKDVLGSFRQRAIDVAKKPGGAEISTTIDFQAPKELLGIDTTHAKHSDQSGQLKLHASLHDAASCNQCHDVGDQPLHAAINYEFVIGNVRIGSMPIDPPPACPESQSAPLPPPPTSPFDTDDGDDRTAPDVPMLPLDPTLIVHAN